MVYFKESYIVLGAVGVYPDHSIYGHLVGQTRSQVKCPPMN